MRNKLRELDSLFDFSVPKIVAHLRATLSNTYFYRLLLENLRPKQVFFSSFSGYIPVIQAANEMGIPTVDLQHGGMPEEHLSLTHYSTVPRDGYSCLPRQFWCWNAQTRDLLNRWWGSAPAHDVVWTGNPWWSDTMIEFQRNEMTPQEKALHEKMKAAKSVLVCLSTPPHHELPEFVEAAIDEAGEELNWNIRLHPIGRGTEEALQKRLARFGSRVNIKEATSMPLPVLLSQTDIHLTSFSTVWKEAAGQGIPTGFWHEDARRYFSAETFETVASECFDTASIARFVNTAAQLDLDDRYSLSLRNDHINRFVEK